MTDVTDKVEQAIARFERVTRQLDERDGPARDAARRERQRLNAGLGRTVDRVAIAAGDLARDDRASAWSSRSACSAFSPRSLAIVAAVLDMIARGGRRAISAPAPSADLPNGTMVERFDSYIYRSASALPAPAQAELDAISRILPLAKQTLSRLETLDPTAQDARRLMSIHLPGLIERYERVPPPIAGKGRRRQDRRPAAGRRARRRPRRAVRGLASSLPAPTSPRSKRRAASSSRATATACRKRGRSKHISLRAARAPLMITRD